MPRLANERNELYCYHRAKGMIPKKAMVAAGFPQGGSTYQQLEEDPEVVARISELTHEIQLKREQQRAAALEAAKTVGQITGTSKAWVLQKLAEIAVDAKAEGDFDNAIKAVKLIGDEYNMFKGASAVNEDENATSQVVDASQTENLLDTAENALAPPIIPDTAPKQPEPDFEQIERLIGSTKRVTSKERQLSTGSETDVALTPDAEIEGENT